MKRFERAEDFERPSTRVPEKVDFTDHELLQTLLLSEGEALSERSRVEIFLNAVNAGAICERDIIRIGSGLRRVDGLEETEADDHRHTIHASFIEHWRQLLGAVVNEPSIISPTICMHLAQRLRGRVFAVPAPRLTRDGFAMNFRLATTGTFPALDYANVLLLSNFVNDLCQCHLPMCRKFFLAEPVPVGRPRREYCTEKHRDEFFKQTGADRVAASRAGETAERWRQIKARHPEMTPTKWKAQRAKKHK